MSRLCVVRHPHALCRQATRRGTITVGALSLAMTVAMTGAMIIAPATRFAVITDQIAVFKPEGPRALRRGWFKGLAAEIVRR